MTTKDLIKELQQLDPEGTMLVVCWDGSDYMPELAEIYSVEKASEYETELYKLKPNTIIVRGI